jgi:hypothetical protein
MIRSKPYGLEIVMNAMSQRELERYVRALKPLPGDLACTASVFVLGIPRGQGSSEVEEL